MICSLAGALAAPADLDLDGDLDLVLWSAKGAAAQAWTNDRLWAWRREPSMGAFEINTVNTSVTELLLVKPSTWRLVRYNDHAHLAGLQPATRPA